jgi:hypothetical protein
MGEEWLGSVSDAGDACKLRWTHKQILLFRYLLYVKTDPFCDDDVCVINLLHLMC